MAENLSPLGDSNKKDDPPRILVDRVAGGGPLPANILHVPPRLPDAPVRIDRRPRVSDDAEEIAAVRREWEREVDELYEAALDTVCSGGHIYLEHLQALRQRREDAVEELRAIMDEEGPWEAGQARAAATLYDLGDPAGEAFLLDALESPSAALRKAALAMLREWNRRVDLTDADRARRVLAQFDHADPDVVLAASDLCAWKKVPGAEERMATLLAAGRAPDPGRVALDLARIATTPESVQALLPHLFGAPPSGHYPGYHFQLDRLLGHADARIREPVRRALHAYTRRLTGPLRHEQHVVYDLAETADVEAVPVLEEIRDHAEDPASRLYALRALARLQPARAVDLVLDFMARHGRYQTAIDVLREHASEQDAGRIIAAVAPPRSPDNPGTSRLNGPVVRLLLERLGEEGRQVVADRLEDVEPDARMEAVWALRGLTARGALAELHAAGVLPEPPDVILARMTERPPEEEGRPADLDGPDALLRALGEAGLVTTFDTETGMLPCAHHRLVLEFAAGTAGRFVPECPVQVWHQSGEEDFNAPYTVAFMRGGRVYAFGAENYGDYYDVEAVVGALNFALGDAGRAERFLGVAGMGQCAFYVFAEPGAFLPLAVKYGIPVCDDHAAPMRAGRAFEEQVAHRYAGGEEDG